METILIEILKSLLPAVIVALLAYYFFNGFIKNEDGRRRFLLQKDNQADALPVRLQAYERLALFLERIKPSQLLIRISPQSDDKSAYEQLLILTIEQEFEHNLSQQIYLSDELWNIIKSAKNGTIQIVRQTVHNPTITTAGQLREHILQELLDNTPPSSVALEYLKKEIKEVIG
ncbi:hypothetical protein [Flavimarina sp. Hel_I_48]|uniref:DUF7935 family protein n=1 Tax=Flavimarina sp. Hel_I_48 TaxID=1392488 RepID=UPI0004DF58DF|nr:hypothetical protein [Flavimarina sp. Hel_I_48]